MAGSKWRSAPVAKIDAHMHIAGGLEIAADNFEVCLEYESACGGTISVVPLCKPELEDYDAFIAELQRFRPILAAAINERLDHE